MANDEGEKPEASNEQQSSLPTASQWRDENDTDNPFNWPVRRKWTVTLIACYVTLIVGINSTSITSAAIEINNRFGVSDEHFPNSFWPVTAWNTGAALAPMVILPIMEDFGVRVGYLVTYTIFFVFVIPQAVAPNFVTLIVTRFIAGCCGGVLQDAMDGIIADIWAEATERSLPVTYYVFCLLAGVTLGPVFGGAVTGSLYWRWVFYIQLIICGASAPFIYLIFRETRGPIILAKRAKHAPKLLQPELVETRALDEPHHHSLPLKEFLYGNVIRPAQLLVTEPVVFFFTLLSALSYGLVFISTQSVTQVYQTNYGWEEYQAGLVQSSIVIGEFFGFLACLWQNRIFQRATRASVTNPNPKLPEVRLYLSIPASFLGLAGGMFWYGWASYPWIHWMLPSVGLALIGFGSVVVMQAIMMYITDAYAKYAASASAAICFGENLFAAFLPLASMAMYTSLGFQWASSLLGFVAFALSFAPIVLVLKGEAIRNRSRFMSQAVYE